MILLTMLKKILVGFIFSGNNDWYPITYAKTTCLFYCIEHSVILAKISSNIKILKDEIQVVESIIHLIFEFDWTPLE